MSYITNKGKKAKESSFQEGRVDLKEVYLRLKDGDSVKVRILTDEDYVEYICHGSFSRGIYTQPCIEPVGEKCAYCEASNYKGGEKDSNGKPEWNHLYAKKRYLFGFVNIETGKKVVFDATKNQAKKLIASIEEYVENINEIAFNFKRTGNSTDTNYSLNPILKLKKDEKEAFEKAGEEVFDMEFFEMCLLGRKRPQQIKELKDSGFPIEEVFSKEDIESMEALANKDDDFVSIKDSEGEIKPSNVF